MRILTDPKSFDDFTKHDFVVIDFFADWCGPCQRIAPEFKEMERRFPDVHFAKVDIEELEDVAELLDVNSLPTFIGFKEGKIAFRVVGADIMQVESNVKKMIGF